METERCARSRPPRVAHGSGGLGRLLARNFFLVVLLLGVALLHPAGAAVRVENDGTLTLTTPWDDADHTRACPNPDSRPCPVLVLNNPAVFIQTQETSVRIRDVASLTQEEEDANATTPFFIYDYKYVAALQAKRYTVYSGVETFEVTFTSAMGSTWYDVGEAQSCGVTTDNDDVQAMKQKADLSSGPLSFSITNTLPKINCFLGAIRFSKTGGRISSDMQLAQFGAMSTMTIWIRSAQTTSNLGSAYEVLSVIFYDSIMFQPIVLTCPSSSYPFPDGTQLPSTGLPDIAQPVAISTWQRSQLSNGQDGLCYSNPISAYPIDRSEEVACPNVTYGEGRFAPVCQPCGVTQSDWIYLFEDSPTVTTLSNIKFEDGLFFYGSAEMSMELIFGSHEPYSQANDAVMTANPGKSSVFAYCAHTDVAAAACAATSSDAFGGIWVPVGENEKWGTQYKIRIVASTDKASMCLPGSEDCDSTEVAPNRFVCVDPPDTGIDNIVRCPCKRGLCYTVNGFQTASSRLLTAADGRSRMWFEVFNNKTEEVVQTGYLDLRVDPPSGDNASVVRVATGFMHSYPASMGSKLNWFKFSPMKISGTYSDKRLTLDLLTDVSLHPQLLVTVESDFGLLDFPDKHDSIVRTPAVPARQVTLRGSLRELTITLSRIQYQVNHMLHPHLNTQTKGFASSEHIRIIYDKTAATQGRVDPGGVGPVTVFDIPVIILATNDQPLITSPPNVSTDENVLTRVGGVSLVDVDVQEVFVDSADSIPSGHCPPLPGEAHHAMTLTVFSKYGKVYVNETGIDSFPTIIVRDGKTDAMLRHLKPSVPRDIVRKLLQDTGDVICGLDSRLLCIMIPSQYFRAGGGSTEIAVFVGPQYIEMLGTLPCLNSAVRDLRYMPMEDYNNNVPPVAPSDKAGCPIGSIVPLQGEAINITIKDSRYSGCVENIEKMHSVEIDVSVASVEQLLIISSPELVSALEGFRFSFSSYRCEEVAKVPSATCAAMQVLSRDNGDITILERYFRAKISAKHGTLSFAHSDNLSFLMGDGSDDEEMQIFGKLCDVNAALRTLSYMPNPDFNTEYDFENKTWTPATKAEFIELFVEQPSDDGSVILGPSVTKTLPVSIKAVDKVPLMSIIAAGTGDTSSAVPATRRQISDMMTMDVSVRDIYFCGGKVSCVCPASALACVQVEDADSCDAKDRHGLACDSKQRASANPRLIVRSEYSSLWFFDGISLASWDAGEQCSTSRSIGQRHVKEMSDYRPGNKLHALDLVIPLPHIQSGVLRIWASKESYGADTIEIALQGAAPAAGIRAQNLPVVINVNNVWCASLDPPVCVAADFVFVQKLQGSTISGPVIVVLGLLGAAALMLLCVGLGPGAQITKILGAGTSKHLDPQEALELSQMQESIAQFNGKNTHQGQWIMARDNRRRPFWYHTVTRETTWIDPSRAHNKTEQLQLDRVVDVHDIEYLQSPYSLQNLRDPMKDRHLEAHAQEHDDQYDEALQHADTGEEYSTREIVNEAAPVDFPGAWNAQADINDVDNSFVTAMLITKSNWVRDHDRAGSVTGPLQRLAMERQKQQQVERNFEEILIGNGPAVSRGSNRSDNGGGNGNDRNAHAQDDEHLVAI